MPQEPVVRVDLKGVRRMTEFAAGDAEAGGVRFEEAVYAAARKLRVSPPVGCLDLNFSSSMS